MVLADPVPDLLPRPLFRNPAITWPRHGASWTSNVCLGGARKVAAAHADFPEHDTVVATSRSTGCCDHW